MITSRDTFIKKIEAKKELNLKSYLIINFVFDIILLFIFIFKLHVQIQIRQIAHLIQEWHNSKFPIFQESTFSCLKRPLIYSETNDIKCPTVAIIKIRGMPFIPIEKAFSVPSYDVLNSKPAIFELCQF